jgi:hypothetical protein
MYLLHPSSVQEGAAAGTAAAEDSRTRPADRTLPGDFHTLPAGWGRTRRSYHPVAVAVAVEDTPGSRHRGCCS